MSAIVLVRTYRGADITVLASGETIVTHYRRVISPVWAVLASLQVAALLGGLAVLFVVGDQALGYGLMGLSVSTTGMVKAFARKFRRVKVPVQDSPPQPPALRSSPAVPPSASPAST